MSQRENSVVIPDDAEEVEIDGDKELFLAMFISRIAFRKRGLMLFPGTKIWANQANRMSLNAV